MKIAGIDFPGPLLNALRDGKLVVFAGAGVSMGEPACLPNFKHLAQTIAREGFHDLEDGEEIDRFLGRLQYGGVKVHERAAEALFRDGLEPTELHRNLLRLYPDAGPVYVVTTNFDLLFEQAAEDLFGSVPEVFRAPALPLGRQFNGIIHLHGAVSTPSEMVITDEDFGRAYMTEGWAARFLVELFSNFTILFVGYSYDDIIMRYLTRALSPRETNRRFTLTQKNDFDAQQWRLLEIEPITYPQSSENDHSALDEGLRRLADLIRRGAVDWHREITAIAENPPSLDEETKDLIEYALGDATRTRFFTESATSPEWIDWLDEREYLNPLFLYGTLSERDRAFSWWLVKRFVHNHTNKLFLLIGKHNMHLHPNFWHDLVHQIATDREVSWDKNILVRWVALLLATAQRDIDIYILLQLGELCIQHEMLDSLLQIFDVMVGSRFRPREDFFLLNDDEDDENPPVDVELLPIGDHYTLNQLWELGLKPRLSQVAEPLLNRVIKRLEERYITLCIWQQIHHEWDSDSRRRSAIEPHEQDIYPQEIDVLINVARDCLEWLVSNETDAAMRWCDRLVYSDAPLHRRLAVHGVSKREDLTANHKINWLLIHTDLHELPIRHEVFRAVRLAYPEAGPEHRRALISAIWAFRWPHEAAANRMEHTAKQHFRWFDWLHKSDLDCALARGALDEVLAEYPNFMPTEHPDLAYWRTSDWVDLQTSWPPEELLTKPAADWLNDLLSFQSTEWEEGDHIEPINNVAEASKRNFNWGLDLADALGEREEWEAYLWSALIHAWSTMELSEDRHSRVLHWLGRAELYPKHNREIARTLYTLVKHDGPDYALNLLPRANKIAVALWHHLDQPELVEETDDWLRLAIDYPAWDLANFWLSGFSLWRQHQEPRPTVLSEEYRAALSDIVGDRSLSGKLGRTILTSEFAFLLTVDEAWTREHLLPLFEPDSDDFQAAWDGFFRVRLNPAVAEAMKGLFLKAVERINTDLFNQRDRFIKYYIYMFEYLDENPLDRWIPKFFQYASQEMPSTTEVPMLFSRSIPETKDLFAAEVGRRLQHMAETEQQELWQRWLKRYWANRLQGVPTGELEIGEVVHMLNWLPHLTSVFPEAVDIAVQMTVSSLQGCYVIEELSINNENDLWQKHPESVVKLLIYLREYNLPGYSWDSARALIDNLLALDISSGRKQELEEIKVQL